VEVYHQFYRTDKFYPAWDVDYLFLGTFNPCCGEQLDYYYRRELNGFWDIIKGYFDPNNEYPVGTFAELATFMEVKKFGCVDVIKKVTFPDNRIGGICGQGYSDQELFRIEGFTREYTFCEIKNLILEKKIKKVFSTWGKRNNPVEFRILLNDFILFCNDNGVCFTPLPSPSGRIYRGVNIPIINGAWIDRIENDFCNQPV